MLSSLALSVLLAQGSPCPLASPDSTDVPRFDVFAFGFEGPTWTTAFDVNATLEVSGSYGATGNFAQAFVGRNTTFEPLQPVPGYGRAVGVDIDSRSRVALRMWYGQIYQLGLDQHVGYWERETGPVDLHTAFLGEQAKGAFGGVAPDKSDVFDANDDGRLVGWLSLGTAWGDPTIGRYVAFRADVETRALDALLVPNGLPPSYLDAWARAIDADGDVVGNAFERVVVGPAVFFRPSAVAWLDGVPVSVGSPDPTALPYSTLVDLDDSGRAVGWATSNLANPVAARAFAWHKSSGRMEWLDPVAGYPGARAGTCANGFVTGASWRWNSSLQVPESTPTLWCGNVAHEIGELVPRPGPWLIASLGRVDEHGRVLALATLPRDPKLRNVLLVPRSGLEVDVPLVGLTSQVNSVRVRGATPGARVELLIGYAPKVEPLDGCADPYAIVGVTRYALTVAPVLAGADGRAEFEFLAPVELGAVEAVYFQALEPDNCRTGEVRSTGFF